MEASSVPVTVNVEKSVFSDFFTVVFFVVVFLVVDFVVAISHSLCDSNSLSPFFIFFPKNGMRDGRTSNGRGVGGERTYWAAPVSYAWRGGEISWILRKYSFCMNRGSCAILLRFRKLNNFSV
jgi:hypothetical protein